MADQAIFDDHRKPEVTNHVDLGNLSAAPTDLRNGIDKTSAGLPIRLHLRGIDDGAAAGLQDFGKRRATRFRNMDKEAPLMPRVGLKQVADDTGLEFHTQ
jgi:hypothetical protein